MRKPRDGEDTRERVLAAATELFAEGGFAGTSLAAISKRCGISDGLILHHFQTKDGLYRQVLEEMAGRYGQTLAQAWESAGSPGQAMQQTLAATFEFWKRDTTYQRISQWAALEGRTELSQREAGLTVGLVHQVEQLQQQGLIDRRYAPAVFLTLIVGPIHFWLRYRDQFKASLDLPDSTEAMDALFLDQLTGLVKEMSRNILRKETQ
jgi:TetR/AcrR family transcriptional regulator